MLKIDNIGFVGGDTRTMEYDLGTKIAGSVVECPMRVFRGSTTNIANLTIAALLAGAELTQAQYDSLKAQDGNNFIQSHANSGVYDWIGIELDLTPLCNALFGGSNAALKAALKSIQADAWASAWGSNGGVAAYGCDIQVFNFDGGNVWNGFNTMTNIPNSSSSIAKMTGVLNSLGTVKYRVNSSNKIYIVIISQYASDGTITSTVNLDYVKITVQFSRVPDVLSPIPKTLNKEFTIVLKGFSPAWDNTQTLASELLAIITPNYTPSLPIISFRWADATKKYALYCKDSAGANTDYNITGMPATLKFQCITFAIRQDANGIEALAIINGTTVLYKSAKSALVITGDLYMYLLKWYSGNYANGYLESIFCFDECIADRELEVIMRGRNVIDAANSELNSLADEYENSNLVPLFNDSRWTKYANSYTSDDGKTLTLIATAAQQYSSVIIPVLPNNKYELRASVGGGTNNLGVYINEFYNSIKVKSQSVKITTVNGVVTFITGSTTNNVGIVCNNDQVGVFTFSNLSLRRYD